MNSLDVARSYRAQHGHLPDGLFVGLTEAEHHDDPALGSTDHKQLLTRPVQWRFKRMKEMREALGLGDSADKPEETIFQAFGNAVDCLLFEPEQFDKRYVQAPEPPSPVLYTREQMREALGSLCNLPRNAGHKDYEIEVKRHGVGLVEADWLAMRTEIVGERVELSARWAALLRLVDRVSRAPRRAYGGKSLRETVLTDGLPQVTVIATLPEGLRLKCRFDWLRPRVIIDGKTYSVRDGVEIQEAFWSTVARFAYDMQAAHYIELYGYICDLIDNDAVYIGDGVDWPTGDWLRRLRDGSRDMALAGKAPGWVWLGVTWDGMPEMDEYRFPDETILMAAREQVKEARKNFLDYSARFGPDEPWVADRDPIPMTDVTCPMRERIMSRGAERWRNMP